MANALSTHTYTHSLTVRIRNSTHISLPLGACLPRIHAHFSHSHNCQILNSAPKSMQSKVRPCSIINAISAGNEIRWDPPPGHHNYG